MVVKINNIRFPTLFFCFITFAFISQAQLRVVPLQRDTKRGTAPESNIINKLSRTEATVDSVNPGISISMIGGHIPRCNTETDLRYTFQAQYYNAGSNPSFQWQVNGFTQGTGSVFSATTLKDKDLVACRLNSTLACARKKSILSNSITIIDATSLMPAIEIISLDNAGVACADNYPITIVAKAFNVGSNPQINWLYAGTTTGKTGFSFVPDSLPDKKSVSAAITSDLACATTKNTDTSVALFRSIKRIVSPTLLLSLDSVTNATCGVKLYNFSAKGDHLGTSAIYKWYINNSLNQTTASANFSTALAKNGDDVKVKVASSVACANPAIVSSDSLPRLDTLTLPFFEDFSTSFDQPDIDKWVKKGGVYVNNSYAKGQPTYNTATFDGLKYNGLAYDTLNANSLGKADNLTSLPIDLSATTRQDSTYLSFFWQPKGLGETPDGEQGDVLRLYFKNDRGTWVNVWQKRGFADSVFTKETVGVATNSTNNYYHSSFQFKFENTGRLSGTFDIWNVDYIFLNKNRTKADVFFLDQSFSTQPIVLFSHGYTSLPYTHFNAIKDTLGNGITVSSNYNNLDKNPNNNTYFIDASYDSTKVRIRTDASIETPGNATNVLFRDSIPNSFWKAIPNAKTEVAYTFSLNGDKINSDNKGIDYTVNNTLRSKTILDNFYAYDDGSAEYGIGLNQKFATLLYRFTNLKRPDTLRQIAVSFTQLGRVLFQQSFNLVVSKNRPTLIDLAKSPPPPNVLLNDNFPITYATTVNNWTVYNLENPIVIDADSFYIGYKQITDDALAIGWDRNTNASKQIFYNINNRWENYTDSQGSLLLRPVFGNFNYVLETQPEAAKQSEPLIFPIPAESHIYTNQLIEKATLYDLHGNTLQNFANTKEFYVGDVPTGMYILKLETNRVSYWKKVVKQ